MIGMKVRYDILDVDLKISNVSPRDVESYVLMTASDGISEIVFTLSHEQAEQLENELNEANRRWRATVSNRLLDDDPVPQSFTPLEVNE